MARVHRIGFAFVALALSAPRANAQNLVAPRGHVVVLAEPSTITWPRGAAKVPAAVAEVNLIQLRDVFTRHNLIALRRAAPFWDEFRRAYPTARVQARQKNQLMPPDALTDLSLLYVLEFPETVDIRKVVDELNASAGIVYAGADGPMRSLALRDRQPASAARRAGSMLSPNDPLFVQGLNWGFSGQFGVRAAGAWDIQTGLPSTRIAIFDTGIETTHPDFGAGSRIADQFDFVNDDGDAFPDADQSFPPHGIATAGIAAAQTNDNFGSAGLCGGFAPANPGCQILAAKVLGSVSTWQRITEWFGFTSRVGDATSWALARNAKVINNSWCSETVHPWVHDAFRNAYLVGALVTASSGNTEFITEENRWKCDQETSTEQVAPAAFGDILMSVGATDQNGNRVVFPGFWESGQFPAVVAPGVGHHTDMLGGATGPFSGTSAAAPFVSGLAGLLFSEATAKGITLTAWDVRQIIQNTARQKAPIPPGYNNETGYGLIDASAALQLLQPPNQLTFAGVSPILGAQCYSQTGIQPWTFWASGAVVLARRCEIRHTVTFAKRYATPPIVWGRPVSPGGITPSDPNSQVYFTGVVPGTVTTTGAQIRTYVYETWSLTGQPLGWYPYPPSQVGFGYAVVGQVAPFIVTATAPTFVTRKSTYPLTGSASDAANSWAWDQDYGSGYGWWASTQNSAFTAYGGTYTLNWRLIATRNFDSARDTGFATTEVCIRVSPPCFAAVRADQSTTSAESTTELTASSATGDHFGSGVWIGFPNDAHKGVVRMYSFTGQHETSPGTAWPNVLERDGGDWAYSLRSGSVTFTTRRYPAGDGRFLVRVSGRIAGTGTTRSMALGLAADPDLGEPQDDAMGFDQELGLAWVRDTASGRHLGYLAFVPAGAARVQQFGSGLAEEPRAPADALRLMQGATQVAAGQFDDVRFLFSVPEVGVNRDGRFGVTFVVLRANSEAALFELARATRQDEAALLARIPADPAAPATDLSAFGLRQSLGGTSGANLSGDAGPQSPVSRLQTNGITALDYSVPEGQEVGVRIRIYNSRGQLVRTLVDQQVGGGGYSVEWDRLNDRGQRVSPGVYVAVMEAGTFRATRKLVLTR